MLFVMTARYDMFWEEERNLKVRLGSSEMLTWAGPWERKFGCGRGLNRRELVDQVHATFENFKYLI